MTAEFGQALTSAAHQLAQAALTLDAAVALHHRLVRAARQRQAADQAAIPGPEDSPDVQSGLDRLADGAAEATGELAEALQWLRPPGPLPRLRQLQADIASMASPDAFGLQEATDSLVDAVNTAADVTSAHLGACTGK